MVVAGVDVLIVAGGAGDASVGTGEKGASVVVPVEGEIIVVVGTDVVDV